MYFLAVMFQIATNFYKIARALAHAQTQERALMVHESRPH